MNFITRSRDWLGKAIASAPMARTVSALVYPRFNAWALTNLPFIKAVEEGYKNLVWVHRCINAYSQQLASVPWRAYSVKDDGTETYLPNHPFETLMNNPNPFFGRKEFFDTFVAHVFLAGRAYMEKVYVQGQVKQLWMVRPDWVTPNRDQIKYIDGYSFLPPGAGTPTKLSNDQIVEFRYIDPLDSYGSMSVLTAASRTMEMDNAAIVWNKALLDNQAVPGGVFNIPVASMTKPQRDELKLAIQEEYTSDQRFQAMVLWGGVEWKQMGLSPADMQFLNQREVNKYEICAIMGVPPMVVGATQDPTYANYQTGRLAWWEDGIIPLLEWVRNKMNAQVAPTFGPNIRIHYDLSRTPAMRSALTEQTGIAYKLWQMGYPINMINKRLGLGLDSVKWGDEAYAQINMCPIDQLQGPGSVDTAPKPKDPKEDDEENEPVADDEETED